MKLKHYLSSSHLLLFLLMWIGLIPTTYAQVDREYSDENDSYQVPFEITTLVNGSFAEDTHWYAISVSTGKYWHTKTRTDNVYCTYSYQTPTSDEYLWCFTGNNVTGYRLYNKAKGTSYIAYAASNLTHEPIVMTQISSTANPRTFKVSDNSEWTSSGINFYYPGLTTACINDLHGDGMLTLWVNSKAPVDQGCRMTVTLVEGGTSTPDADGLPFKPTTLLANGSLSSSTHWYTMKIRGNKLLFADEDMVLCEETETISNEHLWAFVGDKSTGFQIYNYATGSQYKVYAPTSTNDTQLFMYSTQTADGTDRWQISENIQGGYNFFVPNVSTACWNDFSSENRIALWVSTAAPSDLGSCIVFEEKAINSLGNEVPVTAIQLGAESTSLFVGERFTLNYTVLPENATTKTVRMESQDTEVCTIDETTSEIVAVATGETFVTVYATDGSGVYATFKVVVKDGDSIKEINGPVTYIYFHDGRVVGFPDEYISSSSQDENQIQITALDGTLYTYNMEECAQISNEKPTGYASFTSFKFNNKYNRDITTDAFGTIVNDSLIQTTVVGIGKWLTASFQVSDETSMVYVDTVLQKSKVSRHSFAQQVLYTISRPGHTILRNSLSGEYMMLPLGKDYRVNVDFLTDHPTSTYNVPTIHINTDDGLPITSKTEYKTATIEVNGAGVFPDMATTAIQIKGRGNSSWSSSTSAKNPYHLKFDVKTALLGLRKGKHWNLIANKQSMSLMTNAIGMKIARLVGTQAANDEIPVELYLNGEYRGSYNVTEKVGFGNNSLDVSDTLTNAVLLELDSYYDEVNKFKTASALYTLPVNIKEPETFTDPLIPITKSDIQGRVVSMLTALKNGEGIEKHVNVNSMATFLMTNELICNFELMHPKSTFYFNRDILDSDSLFHFGPVWDFDWAYGYENGYTYFNIAPAQDYWTGASHMECASYMKDLRYNSGEVFEKEYFRVWTDFKQNRLAELLDYCDEYLAYALPSFNHDDERWYRSSNYEGQIIKAKKWLSDRVNHIYNYLADDLGLAEKYPEVIEDPTPVLEIEQENQPSPLDDHIYTLDGRMMPKNTRLPRGIYIIQGRKVVVQ